MEYKLLLLMIAHKGMLTHNYIVKELWGYDRADHLYMRLKLLLLRACSISIAGIRGLP